MTVHISDEQSIVLAAGTGVLAALLYGVWIAGQPMQPAPSGAAFPSEAALCEAGSPCSAPAAVPGAAESYEG